MNITREYYVGLKNETKQDVRVMGFEMRSGEIMVPNNVSFVANLAFGEGAIGAKNPLQESEYAQFGAALKDCIQPVTKPNTADCVDERDTIALGDGTTDPEILENRIVYQMPGGLALAVTKAAVGADLAYLRDASSFQHAYELTYDVLTGLGYEDGGHTDCGASKKVEPSVAKRLGDDALMTTLPALTVVNEHTTDLLARNWQTKRRLLESGFYGKWDNAWHEDFLSQRVPQNFSKLAVDLEDHITHGHHGQALLLVKQENMGFAKKRFIRITGGQEAFADTPTAALRLTDDIIGKLGGSELERQRMRLEFGVDAPQVLNPLVAKGLVIFEEAA